MRLVLDKVRPDDQHDLARDVRGAGASDVRSHGDYQFLMPGFRIQFLAWQREQVIINSFVFAWNPWKLEAWRFSTSYLTPVFPYVLSLEAGSMAISYAHGSRSHRISYSGSVSSQHAHPRRAQGCAGPPGAPPRVGPPGLAPVFRMQFFDVIEVHSFFSLRGRWIK